MSCMQYDWPLFHPYLAEAMNPPPPKVKPHEFVSDTQAARLQLIWDSERDTPQTP